jgi:hypothetical protein
MSPNKRHILVSLSILIILLFLSSCSGLDEKRGEDLRATLESQNSQLSYLHTQVAQKDQTDQSQWDAISYLSTQMPYALDLITPIPPGITITPTSYSLEPQDDLTFTPTPWLDLEYPWSTRTGIQEIDRVIDAFLLWTIIDRLELVRYITTPCITNDRLGAPPQCLEDEPEGTLVTAFPVSSGEGFMVRPEGIDDLFDFSVGGLYAVYRVPEGAYEADYWPAGEYGVVFTSEEGPAPHTVVLLVEEGEIVRLDFDPHWPPLERLLQKSSDFILPPMGLDVTPFPVCTPPLCEPNEVYHCPDECPGGCGTTCATPTPGVSSGTGQVWGEICFPELPTATTPPVDLFFHETRTQALHVFELGTGTISYQIDLPAGVYVAFAWMKTRSAGGAYTQFLLCGAGENCLDHSLVPFVVQTDHVTTGIDICDWTGNTSQFPKIPDA